MEYIHDTLDFHISRPCAVTLGKFDGLHRGHRKLLGEILRLQKQGYYGVAFTIAPENRPVLLLPEEKRRILEDSGIDCMLRCPFIPEVLSMEPETFVRDVLCRRLNARYIAVGTDFRFGHNRGGDTALLSALQEKYGYRLIVVEKEKYEGREISSTYVREALSAGDVRLAGTLLGTPYTLEGVIRHGRRLGHTLGMPTINLIPPENKLLPPYGVYYCEAFIGNAAGPKQFSGQTENQAPHAACGQKIPEKPAQSCGSSSGNENAMSGQTQALHGGFTCPGITNIGCKPTVDGSFAGAETYLYGVSEELYGRFARIRLLDFRRSEQKFASVGELEVQMKRDIEAGKRYAAENRAKGGNYGA